MAYEQYEGNMDDIYATVMLSDVLEDDERFRKIIDDAIADGDVPDFPAYTRESKKSKAARVRAAKEEGKEAEEYAKELGVHDKLFGNGKKKGKKDKKDSEADLAALIQRNQQNRGTSFLDKLAEKYGAVPKGKDKGKGKGKGGKKRVLDEDDDDGEPSEEAFQAAAARLKKRPAEGKSGSSKRAKR